MVLGAAPHHADQRPVGGSVGVLGAKGGGRERLLFSAGMAVAVAVQMYGCSQSFFEFYHAYFRDPAPPNARILYDPENEMFLSAFYALYRRDPQTGQVGERVPLGEVLRAPINDSITLYRIPSGPDTPNSGGPGVCMISSGYTRWNRFCGLGPRVEKLDSCPGADHNNFD
jgi:hypothetical protein